MNIQPICLTDYPFTELEARRQTKSKRHGQVENKRPQTLLILAEKLELVAVKHERLVCVL